MNDSAAEPPRTSRLTLVAQTPAHLRAINAGPQAYETRFGVRVAEGLTGFLDDPAVSTEFKARLDNANPAAADPWTFGFALVHAAENVVIGLCSFKGPPAAGGIVEIAYGVMPAYQGRGYATEAAAALVSYALNSGRVRTVRAHTLPQRNASTRVLEKCGFQHIGEVIDPEDGRVWRWEKQLCLNTKQ